MIGLWIKNSLTTDNKRKLRYFKSAYNFNAQFYGAAMFFVILKLVQPDKRTGWSGINYKLENMKMSHFKHEVPKSNLKISEYMNEISISGETYS